MDYCDIIAAEIQVPHRCVLVTAPRAMKPCVVCPFKFVTASTQPDRCREMVSWTQRALDNSVHLSLEQ